MAKETVRTAITDGEGNNKLLSVVQSTSDPTKYGLVICNPDGSPISSGSNLLSDIIPNIDYDMGGYGMSASGFGGDLYTAEINSDTDDLDTGGIYHIILDCRSDCYLSSVVPPDLIGNCHMDIMNNGRRDLTLLHRGGNGNPQWQFNLPNTNDIILRENEGARFIRDDEKGVRQYCDMYLPVGGFGTEVQYRFNGGLEGASRTSIDPSSGVMKLISGVDPTAPSAGELLLYSKTIAGKVVPKVKGPSGLDYPLQASFRQNNVCMRYSTAATAGIWEGTTGGGSGTYTTILPTTVSLYTTIKRGAWANVVTTPNQVLGQSGTQSMFFLGNQPNMGGFFFVARAGFDVWTNGGRMFVGMSPSAPIASNSTSYLNTTGFVIEDGDSGAISFISRGAGTFTKTATGLTASTNTGFDFYIFVAPNSSTISRRIVNINTGLEASGTATTNIPVANTMIRPHVIASNAALTTVAAIRIGINRIYIETDY